MTPEEQFIQFLAAEAKSAPLAGRYCELEALNNRPGAFSIVCGAKDLQKRKKVVLKFMGPRAAADPYRAACFDRECQVASQLLGRDNVIQLTGGREQISFDLVHPLSGLPYTVVVPFFAVERARESFTAFLLRHKRPRAVYRRLQIVRDVAKGVARLHRAGYCHRDLKPENVLLFSGGTAKVADLGTCRLHSGVDPIGSSLQYLQPTGDLMYAAPEMYSAAGLDPKNYVGADWFGVGAIMFEAVTGQNLYVSINLLNRHAIKAALAAASDVPGYLKQVATTSGRYPIPAVADFGEQWLQPLSATTSSHITALIRDLCNFDYRARLVQFDSILRRLDIAILLSYRDHVRYHSR